MDKPKPILLVDVDGVLNVFGFGIDDKSLENGGMGDPGFTKLEKKFVAQGFTIRFPFGLTDRMQILSETFECVWATTWEDAARKEIAPQLGGIGSDWPVIRWGNGRAGPNGTWKLWDVKVWCDIHAQGRRVAWVDDDLHDDAREWAKERGNTLLVQTRENEGLDFDKFEELMEWALDG